MFSVAGGDSISEPMYIWATHFPRSYSNNAPEHSKVHGACPYISKTHLWAGKQLGYITISISFQVKTGEHVPLWSLALFFQTADGGQSLPLFWVNCPETPSLNLEYFKTTAMPS